MTDLEIPRYQCNGCGCVWYTPDEVNTCCNGEGYTVLYPDDEHYYDPDNAAGA